jgi:hypothetical protein
MNRDRPAIAVFSGPNATISNSPPLVTGRTDGTGGGRDVLRPQRLAAPVTVYVEQFSAHPMESDVAELYGPPDGWLSAAGELHEHPVEGGRPVYRIELRPEDGPYLLPYVGRQADGSPWLDATTHPGAPQGQTRQTFYPDARSMYEEIDRFGIGDDGFSNLLSKLATFDFFRAAPSAGPMAAPRPGSVDIRSEVPGEDFFAYYPHHLQNRPTTASLATATNLVQATLGGGDYLGGQWLESTTTIEETLYWMGLLVDTRVPIVGHSAQRAHLSVGADGPRNIVDGVHYLVSKVWEGPDGDDALGAVLVVDQLAYPAREVAKVDARPGAHIVAGGQGGVVAALGGGGWTPPTFVPTRLHTNRSQLNLTRLPVAVRGTVVREGVRRSVDVAVKDGSGRLVGASMPAVRSEKYGAYQPRSLQPGSNEPALDALTADAGARFPLAGIVGEGSTPYGEMYRSTDEALRRAVFSGIPVVKVGRGFPAGEAHRREPLFIGGGNLSATKARILLMACLLKLGSVPFATDPGHPSEAEVAAALEHVAAYQALFDTH